MLSDFIYTRVDHLKIEITMLCVRRSVNKCLRQSLVLRIAASALTKLVDSYGIRGRAQASFAQRLNVNDVVVVVLQEGQLRR